MNHQVFQGLVRYETGSDGTVRGVPGLAESWSVNDDATVWTFRLRKGVTFQPPVSREVTAQDFVDDWNYVTTRRTTRPCLRAVADQGYRRQSATPRRA